MPTARDRVLAAAITLAARDGVPALTLDSVAAEAGVSKGGLLYHFASKDALLAGMVESAIQRWDTAIDVAATADPAPGGRRARAYLQACCRPEDDRSRALALLAAAALSPASAAPWREAARRWAAEDGGDVDLLVARLATDGLWLAAALGLYDLDDDRSARLAERIAGLTRGAVPSPHPRHGEVS
jgi:AcrR family transcriptional regulator